MNFGFIIDNQKCIGCHACTVACKAEHETPIGVNRTWVKYIEKGEFPHSQRHFSVMRCNHCDDAPCIEICPVTALFRREDGIVDFDNQRCIGCKACMQACPYDALYLDPDTLTAAKCNYCAHRVDIGLEPACVNVCPTHAIISGDLDDPGSEIAQLWAQEKVTVRKPEKGTRPKLAYIEGDQASLQPTATDPSTNYMSSSQGREIGHYVRYAESRSGQADVEVLVPQHGDREKMAQKAQDVLQENVRRVYDAPVAGAVWGWEVSAYIWTKSIAAGAFWVPFAAHLILGIPMPDEVQWLAVGVALVFLVLTGMLLVKDLGRPERFLYVLLRPQWKSWLVRGAYIIVFYSLLLILWMIAKLLDIYWVQAALPWPGIALAAATAGYTALLFAQAKGRDFWQSPMLMIHMLVHAIMAGTSVFCLAFLAMEELTSWMVFMRATLLGGILLNLLTIALELGTPHPSEDAQKTVALIVRGPFRRHFWMGTVLVGNLIPLCLLWWGGVPALAAAGTLTLIGLYLAQDTWIRAPQLIPLS